MSAPLPPLPTPEALGAKFVEILRSWATPYQWEVMQRRNAEECDPLVCHSHDWCDANMAMDGALKALGVDQEQRWGDDWAASQEAADLWSAAWESAMPALGRRVETKQEKAQ